MKADLNKITGLFTDDLWSIDTSDSSEAYAGLVRFVKLVRMTFSNFARNRMGFQCVALSYFVTLAVIPFCAFIFFISDGLHIYDKILDILLRAFPYSPEIVSVLMEKADTIFNMLEGGGVGLLSGLLFLWAILWMMFQVERVFNNVWGIRKIPRKLYTRFGFYMLVLILSPFIILLFGTGIAYNANITNLIGLDLSDISHLSKIFGYIAFYIFAVFTMSAMYKFIPAVRVEYKYAFKSALVAAAVFTIFQYLYLETQMFVARLNAVYGVIAAVPLFLIWLNFSWQIIIYGAELSYSYQHLDSYDVNEWEQENLDFGEARKNPEA